jgi:YD repeat-containing protein
MKRLFIPLLSLFFLSAGTYNSAFGQESSLKPYMPDIIPPSPTAYKFTAFGNIPFNSSTGAFQYSLPVYTIEMPDFNMPVSLTYSSSGVKIDEVSSVTGHDWSLDAGGIISRVMRGKPDELSGRWYPSSINTQTDAIKIKNITNPTIPTNYDTERDWFSFRVNGLSGNFYFDENLNIYIDGKDFVKIEYNPDSNSLNNVGYGVPSTFTITDNKGYKYIFGGSHEYQEGMQTSTNNSPVNLFYYSAWFLKEIITPNQNKVSFKYRENNMSYIAGNIYSLLYTEQCRQSDYIGNYSESSSYSTIKSRVISEISFTNGTILFDYNTGRQDNGGVSLKEIHIKNQSGTIRKLLLNYDVSPYRLFLKNVKFLGEDETPAETYSFDYYSKEQLPARLSFNKDKYGYYNGRSNNSPFSESLKEDQVINPILQKGYLANTYATADQEVYPEYTHYGMLKTITYPTGGYTNITYEGNSTEKLVDDYTYSTNFIELFRNCKRVDYTTLKFVSNGEDLNFSAGAGLDYNATQNGCQTPVPDPIHDIYSVKIRDLTTGQTILYMTGDYGNRTYTTASCSGSSGDYVYAICPVKTTQGHEYEISLDMGSKPMNAARGTIDIKYNRVVAKVNKKVYAGGVRVKSIYDYANGQIINKRSFYYNELSKYPSDLTSLNEIISPKYYRMTKYILKCEVSGGQNPAPGFYDRNILEISASTLNSLYNNRKQQSYYTIVTELKETGASNNGAIERFYHNANDVPCAVVQRQETLGTAYSNTGDKYYGLLKTEKVYKNESGNYTLSGEKSLEYSFNSNGILTSWVLNQDYGHPLGLVVQNNDVSNVSIMYYYNYLTTVKDIKIQEKSYLPGSNVVSTTTNTYSGSPYYNLKTSTLTTSTGESVITKYQYAPDLAGIQTNMDKMVTQNKVGIPVITEVRKKDLTNTEKPVQYAKTEYALFGSGSLLKPSSVFISKDASSIEERIKYYNYDSFGNPIYFSTDGAVYTIYLWSYSGQYPIAEIKNVTLAEVTAVLNTVFSVSSADALSALTTPNETKLKDGSLQKALPNALVTTYTYKPLVGILTSTDSSGITTYYEYDDLGRLKETYIYKDNIVSPANKQIVQKYEYHYQNQ